MTYPQGEPMNIVHRMARIRAQCLLAKVYLTAFRVTGIEAVELASVLKNRKSSFSEIYEAIITNRYFIFGIRIVMREP